MSDFTVRQLIEEREDLERRIDKYLSEEVKVFQKKCNVCVKGIDVGITAGLGVQDVIVDLDWDGTASRVKAVN